MVLKMHMHFEKLHEKLHEVSADISLDCAVSYTCVDIGGETEIF